MPVLGTIRRAMYTRHQDDHQWCNEEPGPELHGARSFARGEAADEERYTRTFTRAWQARHPLAAVRHGD